MQIDMNYEDKYCCAQRQALMNLTASAQEDVKYNLHPNVHKLSLFLLCTYWKSIHLSSGIKLALQTILTTHT